MLELIGRLSWIGRPGCASCSTCGRCRTRPEPRRPPATSTALLGAFDADPLPGESFAFLLQSDLDDPTIGLAHLDVVGRRLLPPTRLLRSGALTVDPFLLRGASLGAAWRADRSGAAGAVYHAVAGAPPLLSRIPIVVTLLDLAPWELPDAFQRAPASRFGQRLRARLVRDAAAVIVGTEAVARSRRAACCGSAQSRIRVVPLAAHPAFAAGRRRATPRPRDAAARRRRADRLGLRDRFLVYFGRFDARHDVATLLQALAAAGGSAAGPAACRAGAAWPPRVLIVGASPDDRGAARARRRPPRRRGRARLRAGARRPSGSPRWSARRGPWSCRRSATRRACRPSTRSRRGCRSSPPRSGRCRRSSARPGILVEPRDPARLAEALANGVGRRARARPAGRGAARRARRPRDAAAPGSDVATETRRVYADVGRRARRA